MPAQADSTPPWLFTDEECDLCALYFGADIGKLARELRCQANWPRVTFHVRADRACVDGGANIGLWAARAVSYRRDTAKLLGLLLRSEGHLTAHEAAIDADNARGGGTF